MTGGAIKLTAEVKGGDLVVTVADTGIGISAKMLPVDFRHVCPGRPLAGTVASGSRRPHARQAPGRAARRRGGRTQRRCRASGSEFIVRLPVIARPEDRTAAPAPPGAAAAAPARRILIGGRRSFVDSLAMLLRAAGHEVMVVHDGLAAVAAAAEFKPDFAFLDIGLPKMNGYELARCLRGARPRPIRCWWR